MKPLHLCVPVLKRYDLLHNLLQSLHHSSLFPTDVHIVNNGRDLERLKRAVVGVSVEVVTPEEPLGLAESWNWFIQNVPEERLICNDDLTFSSTSLEDMTKTEGEVVSALADTNAFSCFLIRDTCVEKVGLFDESISPGYAYFEDCDYVARMRQKGLKIAKVECGVTHVGSQTTAAYSTQEWQRHHERFLLAQSNYIRKWGRMPEGVVQQR